MATKRKMHIAKAGFEAASTSAEALRHWRGADNLSADAELIPNIRQLIISRARYETNNNGYLAGMLQTLADDTVGTGPRLQIFIDDPCFIDNNQTSASLQKREKRWKQYSKKIKLAKKLRLARFIKAKDGEVFFQKTINNKLKGLNKIDIVLYESEQVGGGFANVVDDYYVNGSPKEVDGIYFDRNGHIIKYRFWRIHPGSYSIQSDSYFVNANGVIHYANIIRPGQHRGISEIASSLMIFNDFRRYGMAVLTAAETAASISFLLETDFEPGDDVDSDEKAVSQVDFMDVIQYAKNSGVAMPQGWKGHQLKAEQPTGTYAEFLDAKLNEACRTLSIPFNVAKGNSSGYNYASGRLDHQVYHRKIAIERRTIEDDILDDLYESWAELDQLEYPEDYDDDISTDHRWMWDGFEHSDPLKEANAQKIRLESGVTTLANECAKNGDDYENIIRQRGKEAMLAQSAGVPLQTTQKSIAEQIKEELDSDRED